MGNEYTSAVIIGFTIEQDDLLRPFIVTKPEKYREEEWTGPKGQKRTERVLVSKKHDVYVLDGTEYEEVSEFVEALEALTNAHISEHGNYVDGCMSYGIESRLECEETEDDGIPLDYVSKVTPDLKRIHGLFKERFGLELGAPAIHTMDSYG
jgi:hypothetical protein